MKFHYIASQSKGKIIEGDLDVFSAAEALEYLGSHQLKPISIREIKGLESRSLRLAFSRRITGVDKIFLTRYLSLMLRVGTDLFKAIDILLNDFERPALKALLIEVKTTLGKGQPFYTAFARYPQYFSQVFVNLVKAGELSGSLEMVFDNLSHSLEREEDLRRRIRAALVYPILLLVTSFLVMTFLITFALPRIAELFTQGGFNPPLFSRVVFAIGLFVNNHLWVILGTILFLVIGGIIFFAKTTVGRRLFGRILAHTPVVRGVVEKIAIQRFASTLAALLKAGLPIVGALEVTAGAVGHERIRLSLLRIAQHGVARGLTIGDAFKRETAFPSVVSNLVAISEKAGRLDEILITLADFYEAEIDNSLKTLVAVIEPLLLLMLGVVIGGIALSILIPIYQLVTQF